jgi:hypothetical protein
MAADLLSVSNEAELEHFLGDLLGKVAGAVGGIIKGPIGQTLGGLLKGVAKTALPIAGAALGNLVAPGIGGVIGGKLASAAGSAFGLELEGLTSEDSEFELAKQFVRLAADAAKNTVGVTQPGDPMAVAQPALTQAMQRYAPGLMNETGYWGGYGGYGGYGGGYQQSGRWVRRGNQIILYGV